MESCSFSIFRNRGVLAGSGVKIAVQSDRRGSEGTDTGTLARQPDSRAGGVRLSSTCLSSLLQSRFRSMQ